MKKFEFSDDDLTLCVEISETLNSDYSQYVWPSSPLLASYIFHQRNLFKDKNILEMSAGTAIPGIVCYKIGAKVVVSERDDFSLQRCIDSINRNNCMDKIGTIKLKWGLYNEISHFDFVLSSDCFYEKDEFEDIFSTIYLLMQINKNLIFYTTYEVRNLYSFQTLLDDWSMCCELINTTECSKCVKNFDFTLNHIELLKITFK